MQEPTSIKNNTVWQFFLGALLILLVGLALFYLLMRPPLRDMGLMAALMGGSGLLSVIAAYLGYRSGWIGRFAHIRWMLAAGYLFAGILAFLNVWVTAWMMFASQHDLLLATGLLVFATGIAVIVGLFLSATITSRIQQLSAAAIMVAKGDLDTRLVVVGRDEMAMLARSFNDMVLQLELAEQKKAGAERLRRDLIAWVGHDLRTPLTSIRAIIEALSDGLIEDEETRLRYLKTAQANIKSLSNLIDDLFEMSQIDAGGFRLELEMGNISDLVSDIYELFAEQARMKGVQLEAYISPDVGLVLMDEKRIGRVLANLISNAIRHTPAGGAVQTNIFKSDSELHAIVKDNGEGIQPGDLPNIFDRFYRGEKSRNRSTGGSGLGLAIARSIVEAHGGSITADSEPGKGTIIRFILPAN